MIFGKRKKEFSFFGDLKLNDGEIRLALRETAGVDYERGYLPTYYFRICSAVSGEVYGRCDLRIGTNKNVRYAGNIGYAVYEPYRGNKYAYKSCILLFELAKRHGMKKLTITCNPENLPSRRTCELLGARYIETVDLPEDHELFLMGEKKKVVYEVSL